MNVNFLFTATGTTITKEVNMLQKLYEVVYSILKNEMKEYNNIDIIGFNCNANKLDPYKNFVSLQINDEDTIMVQSSIRENNYINQENKIIGSLSNMAPEKQQKIFSIVSFIFKTDSMSTVKQKIKKVKR